MEKAIEAVRVHTVMAYCGISREEAASHLQRLKSQGNIGGSGRTGYWLAALKPVESKVEQEEKIERVFKYLEEHKDTSLSQVSADTQLPVPTVKRIIKELERRRKIKLLP